MTTQLLFSLLWPFSFVSTFINSLTKLILWSFPQRAGKGHGTGARNKGFCSFHHSSAENWVKDLLSIALPTREILSPQTVLSIRKLAQASYPCPSEGNTEEARISILWPPEWKLQSQKTKQCGHMDQTLCNSWNYQSCHAGPPKMAKSWWRDLMMEKEWWATSTFLPWHPMNSMKRQKYIILKDETPRLVGDQCATRKEWRNSSKRNEEAEPKQKQHPIVDVSSGGSKIWCCKE